MGFIQDNTISVQSLKSSVKCIVSIQGRHSDILLYSYNRMHCNKGIKHETGVLIFIFLFVNYFFEKHTGANKVTYRIHRHVTSNQE